MDSSTISSLDKDYDDGVYDKANPPSRRNKKKNKNKRKQARSRSPSRPDRPPKLPRLMLVALVSLAVFCTTGTTVSGLYFSRRATAALPITSTDCLGQSWILFSSILGFLYTVLHLQSARKGEPINRAQPPSQHPLHAATVVVARLDTIAWMVSLIIASVVLARTPTPISYANLVACTAVTPTITAILCVAEKAVRPFDLPYLTPQSSDPSLAAAGDSALVDDMPEVTTEDSISRRGSYASPHSNRPNSHTTHAAAVAAAHAGIAGSIGGPRPPPSNVKEARPWAFTNFDHRTKNELAASVEEASYASDTRVRVGGPRPLADSDIAIKRGVLAPPVCSDPKIARVPVGRLQKRPDQAIQPQQQRGGASREGSWGRDWTALQADTGYATPASGGSSDVTPPQPRVPLGVPLFSSRIASRALSPVVEVDSDKRSSGSSLNNASRPAVPAAAAPAQAPRVWTTSSSSQHSAPPPAQVASSVPPTVVRAHSQPLPPLADAPPTRSYTEPPRFTTARYGSALLYDHTGALRPPPPAAAPAPAPAPAPSSTASAPASTPAPSRPATRVRLVRAQDSSSTRGAKQDRLNYATASLRRPQRLTGDAARSATASSAHEIRTPEDDRLFFVNPAPSPTPSNLVRMPGGWHHD